VKHQNNGKTVRAFFFLQNVPGTKHDKKYSKQPEGYCIDPFARTVSIKRVTFNVYGNEKNHNCSVYSNAFSNNYTTHSGGNRQ